MKVAVIPGVGFFNDTPPNKKLIREIKNIPDCELIWCNWKHFGNLPDMTNLDYKPFRQWISEVILDFQTTVKHAFDIPIPEADFYVGHSAGSILSLIQSKPCIIFGSPACLVEDVQGFPAVDCLLNSPKVLNIVHKVDILAYPFKFANNKLITSSWWNLSSWNPVSAHTCYWEDSEVVKTIVDTLEEWKKLPME